MQYGISTTALRLLSLEEKFETAKSLGFDGIEVMITHNREVHSYDRLADLSKQYELPILSIHAPTLLATHLVWGVKPYPKLKRAAEHAAQVGAATVVVHPPYRWQAEYAGEFLAAVREVNNAHGVHIAVENMYPWYVGGQAIPAYGVSWEATKRGADSLTFDFSHATVAGLNIVTELQNIVPRLRHIHLSDAFTGSRHDAHLAPGSGNLPLREAFDVLREANWQGTVVAEINTLTKVKAVTRDALLRQTLAQGRALMA